MQAVQINSRPWIEKTFPKKILAIRFQALGDLMITLPYLQSLKEKTPKVVIHLLTRKEVAEIPKNLTLFDKVYSVGGGRNAKVQFLLCLLLLPFLWWQHYDVVIDLQNHRISKIIRKFLNAAAWSEFDRSSRIFAGERTRLTIDGVNILSSYLATNFPLRNKVEVETKLKSHGWDGKSLLIILNPAGAFSSRQWPLKNYYEFAKLWKEQHPTSQFLILGLTTMKSKATFLKEELKRELIDLVGETSIIEAFAIVKSAALMLTEDSGLMHMTWIQGVPTLALFGSTPSYWSSPLGSWSKCLNSSDLPCGDCFLQECKYGNVNCLTRFSPHNIITEAESLLQSIRK